MSRDYSRNIKRTIRDNGLAYGYSIVITGTVSSIVLLEGSPSNALYILLGSISAAISFSLLEFIATSLIKKQEEKNDQDVMMGNGLNFISVAIAVSSGMLIAWLFVETITWVLAPIVATSLYVLVTAAQIAVIKKIKQAK